jgi:hypothetical protein
MAICVRHVLSIFSWSEMQRYHLDTGWMLSGFLISLFTYVISALLLDRYFVKSGIAENRAAILAVSMMIVAPIFIIAPIDDRFYFGYLSPNLYIIPTQALLKMMTIALFLFLPHITRTHVSRGEMILIFVITILNGLSKPNFLIIMLPALTLLAAGRLAKKEMVNFPAVLCLFCGACLVLSWQYLFKFTSAGTPVYESRITLTAPFDVLGRIGEYAPAKMMLSIVFPVCVAVAYWKEARRDIEMQYAWLLFLFGATFSIFLAETGPNKYAGNFLWCGEISVFVLFFVTAKFLFRTAQSPIHKKKFAFSVTLMSAHILCGFIYFFRSFFFKYW